MSKIPPDELIDGDPEDDLRNALQEGDQEDVDDVLEHYDAFHVKDFEGQSYYSIRLEDDSTGVAILEDEEADVEPFGSWIYDSWTWDGMDDFLGYHLDEEFAEHFWKGESVAYHATGARGAAGVVVSGGLEPRNKTRGIGNRSVGSAVFASLGGAMTQYYGDAVFAIDIDSMSKDGITPHVSQEPEIVEVRQREAIAHMFMAEDFWPDYPSDVSGDTVIFYGTIPLDYLSLEADSETMKEIIGFIEEMGGSESDVGWVVSQDMDGEL